jgi:nucleoside-diphosphate-sugar epimerase
MTSLITGGTGFIGQELLNLLLHRGDTVHVLYRNPRTMLSRPEKNLKYFQGDILDPPGLQRACAGCDRIFHLAGYAKNWARVPQTFLDVNVNGTRNVLLTALQARVQRVVLTSTVMTIGPSNGTPVDESAIRRAPMLTDYERSKQAAEDTATEFVRRGLEVVIVNPTRVFGPGLLNEGNSVTRMIKWYLEGKWRLVPGNGEAMGNYAFVPDVARGHLQAMERGKPGERYILGGENVSYNGLFDLVSRISGRRRVLLHVPPAMAVAVGHVEEQRARLFHGYPNISPAWVKTFLGDWAFSCQKATADLGYRITPLEAALRLTLEWLRNQEHANPNERELSKYVTITEPKG